LRGNHDLGVTDTLPSVCASLTKAMVVVGYRVYLALHM